MEPKNRSMIPLAVLVAIGMMGAIMFMFMGDGDSGSSVSPPPSETSSDGELTPFGVVLLVGFILLTNATIFGVIFLRFRRSPAYKDALENGRAGIAKITAATPTGARYRLLNQPRMYQIKLTAMVDPPNGPPYEAKLLEYFPRELIPNPGDTFHVRIHVDRPEVVAIVHRDPRHPLSNRNN